MREGFLIRPVLSFWRPRSAPLVLMESMRRDLIQVGRAAFCSRRAQGHTLEPDQAGLLLSATQYVAQGY